MQEMTERRKRTQPPGASLGSIFKNPPGYYAGRLIEAAGLKGYTIGSVQVSPVHANFFVNTGGASASDVKQLIDLTRTTVRERFGVELELEIELIGEWGSEAIPT
jgi:UDP-N-acetylmuramate dehydrogenase